MLVNSFSLRLRTPDSMQIGIPIELNKPLPGQGSAVILNVLPSASHLQGELQTHAGDALAPSLPLP